MYSLTLDSFVKPNESGKSQPAGLVHLEIKAADYRRLEEAEAELQDRHQNELMLDIDPADLSLELPKEVSALSDCKLRVYLNEEDERGHFHLVGHRKADQSLFYTNAVLVDYLVN